MATRIKTEYLIAHLPRHLDGRRAKASGGAGAQKKIEAFSENEARMIFERDYPEREISAFGIVGVE